jgi:hypothetical protein
MNSISIYKFLTPYFLLVLFPFAILTGSFLVNAISSILAFIFLLYVIKNKKLKDFKFYRYFILSALFISFFISSLLSNYSGKSFIKTLSFLKYFFFFFSIYCLILTDEKKIFKLSKIVFFISLLLCLDLWFQYLSGYSIIGYPLQQGGVRLTSIFKDEQIPGGVLFKLMPFLIYYLLNINKNNVLYKFKYLIFLFYIFSIIITGERASFVHVIFFLACMVILNFKSIKIKYFLLYFFIFVVCISLLSLKKNSIIAERYNYTLNVQIKQNVYLVLFENSKKIFLNNIFFGSGPQTYRYECAKFSTDCSSHPHNYVVELLSDTGIFGLTFFLLSIVSFVRFKIQSIKNDNFLRYFILIFVMCLFFPFIPTGSVFSSFSGTITWFSFAFMMSLKTKKFNF